MRGSSGRRRPRRRQQQTLFPPRWESLEDRRLLATFLVTTTADSGAGSLRQALLDSNAATPAPGSTNEIEFMIGSGPQTIAPMTALPTITEPVDLNGQTQPGFGTTPIITLDGSSAFNASGSRAGVNGLTITAGNSTVQGLVIDHFGGVGIELMGAGNNVIETNDIGTDLTGNVGAGNMGDGVLINGSPNNTIGGTSTTARNVISDNGAGVSVSVPTSTSPTTGITPVDVASADFNNNGLDDLVTANLLTGDLSVLMNRGGGNFAAPMIIPVTADGANAIHVITGDFNGGGKPDIAVALRVVDPATGEYKSSLIILLNQGNGKFDALAPISLGSYTTQYFDSTGHLVLSQTQGVEVNSIAVGDFGNGQTDVAVAIAADPPPTPFPGGTVTQTSPGGVDVLLGNGDGTFQAPVMYGTSGSVSVAAADFTGDGHLDLALANGFIDPVTTFPDGPGTVSILLNNGNGTFSQTPETIDVSSSPVSAVTTGDFRGDGKNDIAAAIETTGSETSPTPGGAVAVLLGNGNGTFQTPVTYAVGANPLGIAAGDFADNGKLDIVTANSLSNNASVLLGGWRRHLPVRATRRPRPAGLAPWPSPPATSPPSARGGPTLRWPTGSAPT